MNRWYFQVIINKYADFKGRASRKEFWMFVLFDLCIFLMFLILYFLILYVVITLLSNNDQSTRLTSIMSSILILLYRLYRLVVTLPSLALAVRRLHDTGQSGWMLLITAIPLVGAIWFIITMLEWPDEGNNQYGPNPINTENNTGLEA